MVPTILKFQMNNAAKSKLTLSRAKQQMQCRLQNEISFLIRPVKESEPEDLNLSNKTFISRGIGNRKYQEDQYIAYDLPDLSHLSDENIVDNLEKAIEAMAQEILAPSFIANSGSTAVISLIINGKVFVANLGDSRAMYISEHNSYFPLSVDHKPTEPDEFTRVLIEKSVEQHPFYNDKKNFLRIGDKVVGGLAMTRGLGDRGYTKYGLSSKPQTTISPFNRGDMVILASDGLWDAMNERQATVVVNQYKKFSAFSAQENSNQGSSNQGELNQRSSKGNPATDLRKEAQTVDSDDNITIICAMEDGLYGVFDGHIGDEVSKYAAKYFPTYFEKAFELTIPLTCRANSTAPKASCNNSKENLNNPSNNTKLQTLNASIKKDSQKIQPLPMLFKTNLAITDNINSKDNSTEYDSDNEILLFKKENLNTSLNNTELQTLNASIKKYPQKIQPLPMLFKTNITSAVNSKIEDNSTEYDSDNEIILFKNRN